MGVKVKAKKDNAVKQTNKRLNKLARKGKLRRKTQDKLRALKDERGKANSIRLSKIEDDWIDYKDVMEEEDILPDEDMLAEDMKCIPESLSALSDRKRIAEDTPRQFVHPEYGTKKVKVMLPVKTADGSIQPKYMEVRELPGESLEDENDVTEELQVKEKEQDKYSHLSPSELLARRKKVLGDLKKKVANMCQSLLEDPQNNISRLKDLVSLVIGKEVEGIVREDVKKLATVSLTQVFMDILPSYKINSRGPAPEKLKKDTRMLIEFEECLLGNYTKFIKQLTMSAGRASSSHSVLAIKCMCQLLMAQPQFNLRQNIIESILKFTLIVNEPTLLEYCCSSLGDVISHDNLGEVTLDLVRAINRIVKEKVNKVKPCVLQILLKLRIKEVNNRDEYSESQNEKRRQRLRALSKKDRKYQKQLAKLENELKETRAIEDKNTVLRLNTQIMEQVFIMYLRLLKKTVKAKLVPAVLEGLSKFAHVINMEMFDPLLSTLHDIIEHKNVNVTESLHCVHTAMVVLTGEGHVLSIDPCKFYRSFYAILPTVFTQQHNGIRDDQFVLVLKCMDMMFVQRRKQVTKWRVASFIKRLMLLCLICPVEMQRCLLLALRSLFVAHSSLVAMTEDEVYGSGKFMPDLNDPDHCNAHCTNICSELQLLKDCGDYQVKRLASHIASGLPSSGECKLLPELVTRTPLDWYLQNPAQQSIPPLKELKNCWTGNKELHSLLAIIK